MFPQGPPVSFPIEQTMLIQKFMIEVTLPLFNMAAIFRWNNIFILKCDWAIPSYSTKPSIHSQKHHLICHFPTFLNLQTILYTLSIILPPIAEGLEEERCGRLGRCVWFIFLSSVLNNLLIMQYFAHWICQICKHYHREHLTSVAIIDARYFSWNSQCQLYFPNKLLICFCSIF